MTSTATASSWVKVRLPSSWSLKSTLRLAAHASTQSSPVPASPQTPTTSLHPIPLHSAQPRTARSP